MRKLTQQDTDFIIAKRNEYTFNSMAQKLGYNHRTLRNLIKPLVSDGLIGAWPHGGSKKGRAYKANRAKPFKLEPIKPPPITDEERINRLRKYADKI